MMKVKESIQILEEQLANEETEDKLKSDTYSAIISEANKKLKAAVSKKDFVQVNMAQTMLESASKMKEEEVTRKAEIEKRRKTLAKRKSSLLDNFVTKLAKKN